MAHQVSIFFCSCRAFELLQKFGKCLFELFTLLLRPLQFVDFGIQISSHEGLPWRRFLGLSAHFPNFPRAGISQASAYGHGSLHRRAWCRRRFPAHCCLDPRDADMSENVRSPALRLETFVISRGRLFSTKAAAAAFAGNFQDMPAWAPCSCDPFRSRPTKTNPHGDA